MIKSLWCGTIHKDLLAETEGASKSMINELNKWKLTVIFDFSYALKSDT
jgi:hypothetical protein